MRGRLQQVSKVKHTISALADMLLRLKFLVRLALTPLAVNL
jgi:hypothetical protein